jgi:hypothetical protein
MVEAATVEVEVKVKEARSPPDGEALLAAVRGF